MDEFKFEITKKDKKTRARTGIITTPHGQIETPAFSPVATRASVRALDICDLKSSHTQVILANTYHLYLKPGTETIDKFDGFANFMNWDRSTITDSGGYQVSFLWPKGSKDSDESGRLVKITDEGAWFTSHIDGSGHLLTPEKSMEIQMVLGADIIMAFDQPLSFSQSEKQKKEAFARTKKWEERSYLTWQKQEKNRTKGTSQALFGIIQGDETKDLRVESLKFLLQFDFPGLAIGGESIGVNPQLTAKTLETIIDLIPPNKPLHALGLGGGVEGIFEACQRGVDLFDNSSITRMARNGLLFLYPEDRGKADNKFRFDLTSSKYKDDKSPVSKKCQCHTCQNYTRAYLHHLLTSKELLGFRLASIHNVYFMNDLMIKIREATGKNDFLSLKKLWLQH